MLREVIKEFDADNGVTLTTGDIVDVTGWKNAASLENTGFLRQTDAQKATKDPLKVKAKATKPIETSSAPKSPARIKRSALASRPRVFRKAQSGRQ